MKRRIKVRRRLKLIVKRNHLRMRVDKVVRVMIVEVSILVEKKKKKSKIMKMMENGKKIVNQNYKKKNDINHLFHFV